MDCPFNNNQTAQTARNDYFLRFGVVRWGIGTPAQIQIFSIFKIRCISTYIYYLDNYLSRGRMIVQPSLFDAR